MTIYELFDLVISITLSVLVLLNLVFGLIEYLFSETRLFFFEAMILAAVLGIYTLLKYWRMLMVIKKQEELKEQEEAYE